MALLILKRYPLLAPGVTVTYNLEFLAKERMEGMDDLEKSTRTIYIGCN